MKSKRVIPSLLLAFSISSCLTMLAGCEAGSGQIPLANVPPPPEGFANNNKQAKIPDGASPVDANARRK
jgi:hypothetical protein